MKRTFLLLASVSIAACAPSQQFFTSTRQGSNKVRIFDRNNVLIHAFDALIAEHDGSDCYSYAPSPPSEGMGSFACSHLHKPKVEVYKGNTRELIFSFEPFSGFTGGINIALGDVNGDGTADILAGGEGPNGPVKIVSGIDLAVLHNFLAYPGFSGGVRVASGDVNGDGVDDVVIAPGPGRAPHVNVYNGLNGNPIIDFDAFAPVDLSGIRVAVGDVNGDGKGDVIVSQGSGGTPTVKAFSGVDAQLLTSFLAYPEGFTGGVTVGAGDLDGDGDDEIMTGQETNGGTVKVFDAISHAVLRNWMPDGSSYIGGHSVSMTDKPDTLAFGFWLNKATVAGQNSVLGSVFTNTPVGANTIFTTFDNSSLVTTPASATISSGQSFKNFQITTTAINSTINTTVSAKLGGVTITRPLTLAPLIPTSISFNPGTVNGGATSTGRVVVNGVAGPGGRVISIVENSAFMGCPTSVTVPPGGTDVFFPITTTNPPSNQVILVKAIVSAGQCQGNFRVNRVP